MTDRDNMVMRPRLGHQQDAPRRRATEERRAAGSRGHRVSLMRRFGRMFGRGAAQAAAEGEEAGMAGRLASRAAAAAAIVIAVAGAVRIGTGRSFENMGQGMLDATLGGLTDEAAAAKMTRMQMETSGNLMAFYGSDPSNAQVKKVFDMRRAINLRGMQGRRGFMVDEKFQVNSTLDMAYLQAWEYAKHSWRASGFEATLDEIGRLLGRWRSSMGR